MSSLFARPRQGLGFWALAWTIAAVSGSAFPVVCCGQFGGANDRASSTFTTTSSGNTNSLPLKNAHSARVEQEILAGLRKTTSLSVREMPLETLVHRLAQESGVQMQIDYKSLTEANVAIDTQITVHISNVTYQSALDHVLKMIDLRWVIQNEVLLIMTRDVADDITEARVYPVRDLVVYGNGPDADFNSLIDLLQNTIKPDSWTATGGPGSVERYWKNYSLVISQTREVHEQIELLLAQLRRVSDRQGVWGQAPGASNRVTLDRTSSASVLSPSVRVYSRSGSDRLVRMHD